MGARGDGMEVVHRPAFQRSEDTQDGHPPAGPRRHQDGAPYESGQDHVIRDQVGRPPFHVGSRGMDAARDGDN
jgi:hypothetical protein